jgi:hypothetical protein
MAEGLERRLLLTMAKLLLGTARDADALPLLRRPLDWSQLFAEAAEEGMSGLLGSQLRRLAREYHLELPLDSLTRTLHGIFARNGALFGELSGLRAALRHRRLQAILLKGGALIGTAYRGHAGVRPLSDLDLLVKASDLPALQELLMERGFRPVSGSSVFFANGSAAFDLHTDLVNADRIRRAGLAFAFDNTVLWREASPMTPGDPTILILSPVDQALHLTLHALKHSFSRLIWIVDMGLVLQRVKWEHLVARAEATGTLRPLTYAVFLLQRLMGLEVPPDLRARLPTFNWMERAVLRCAVNRRRLWALGEMMTAFSISNLRGKLAYLAEFSFPRQDVLAEVFPSTPSWLRYPRRLLQAVAVGLHEGMIAAGLEASPMGNPFAWGAAFSGSGRSGSAAGSRRRGCRGPQRRAAASGAQGQRAAERPPP